jgi:hypothetical protein
MKQSISFASGLAFSAIGTAIGLYFAWLGFSSTPYDGQQLGMFCGVMGTLVGCTCAFVGVLWRHWQKRSASFVPPQAA